MVIYSTRLLAQNTKIELFIVPLESLHGESSLKEFTEPDVEFCYFFVSFLFMLSLVWLFYYEMEMKFLWLKDHPRKKRLKKIEYTIANQKTAHQVLPSW